MRHGSPVRHAGLAKTATVLGVTGTLQAEQGVVHLVAERLWRPHLPADLATASAATFTDVPHSLIR